MKERFAKLINVKSIVTIVLTVGFAVLFVRRDITAEPYLTIFTTVIVFYFGIQNEKKVGETDGKNSQCIPCCIPTKNNIYLRKYPTLPANKRIPGTGHISAFPGFLRFFYEWRQGDSNP